MPGGTARLRVSGAIARRFGSAIGPSLKGSNSLVWLMSEMSGWMMIGDSWALRAILAIPEAIRLAQTSCARSRPLGRSHGGNCLFVRHKLFRRKSHSPVVQFHDGA